MNEKITSEILNMQDQRTNNSLLWLVAIGFFMETLDSTIVNTALPSMAKDLEVSPLSMQSVIIAYALTLAVFIPASGWVADRFGTRRVYLSAIVIFTFGSLLCALSPNLTFLVISRIIQGAGGSMLLPVGRLTILRAFPGEKYLAALSFVAVPALLGPLIGPTMGGWLVEILSWHWIFLINIPIGIIGCFFTYKVMPKEEIIFKRKLDLFGFFLITTFMICISFALDGLSDMHLSQGLILILFVFGLSSLVAYIFRAMRVSEPLLTLDVFKIRTYSIGILGNMFARIGSSCMPFLLPLFLQLCLGYSPMEAGMGMLPLAIAAILAKKIVPILVIKFGYKRFLITNTIIVGFWIGSFALMSNVENYYLRMLQFFFFGAFNSMQFTAMNTLTMKDLGKKLSSQGNTIYSMIQMLSMSFSVAAAGSLLAAFMKNYEKIEAFHMTFFCMGALTLTSAWIFAQLRRFEKTSPSEIKALVEEDTQ